MSTPRPPVAAVSIVRIIRREDGSPAIHVRPGDAREGTGPPERRLGALHEKLTRDALSGELSDERIMRAIAAHQTELNRRRQGGSSCAG
jgi:hypothetical protein